MSKKSWMLGPLARESMLPNAPAASEAIKMYLKQNPGRPSLPHIEIGRIDNYFYEKTKDDVRKSGSMRELAQLCTNTVLTSYMTRYCTIKYDNDGLYKFLDAYPGFHGHEFVSKCKRLIAENPNGMNFRVEMPGSIEDVFIKPSQELENIYQIWHLQFFKKKTIVKVWLYLVDLDKQYINNITVGPMIMSRRNKDAEEALRTSKNRSVDTDYTSLLLINEILRIFRSNPDAMKTMTIPEHQDVEMYFIRRLVNDIGNNAAKTTNIFGWKNTEIGPNPMNSALAIIGPPPMIMHPDMGCPLVDLTEREIKYMSNYIKKKNYLGRNGEGINALVYLEHPRYGPSLRIQMPGDDDQIDEIITYYELFPDVNFMRFYAVKVINDDVRAYVIIDFKNVSKFNIYDNLCDIAADIYQRDPNQMIQSGTELEKMIPDCFRTVEGVISLLFETIVVHIMLFERPRRARVVRYTERGPRDPAKKKDDPEPDYIVRRILKPIDEAKKIVSESRDPTGAQFGERQYTMEEWERVGHYRRLPHSDRTVWIPETTCKRHLPLSEKEIHIKL